jgi:hypothetical protein
MQPAVYHFKFWADGIYYQHPGCPLPDNFPDDFVVSFNLQFVCKVTQLSLRDSSAVLRVV